MGKVARAKSSLVTDWVEADMALRRLGEIEREKTRLELQMNKAVDAARAAYTEKATPLTRERKVIERDLEKFCSQSRADFHGAQSRALNFGVVRFRATSRLVIHSVTNTIAALRALLGTASERYVRVKEECDKEQLEGMPDETLSQVGVTRSRGEVWGYEINWERLEE